MKYCVNLPILFLVFFAVTGCKKDETGNSNVTETPSVINVTLPVASAIYTNGSVLRTEGDISDINGLATATIQIRNKTSGAILYQQSNPTGNVSFYRFTWNWTVTGISSITTATIKITATDKNSVQVSKEIDILLDN
jgi:hypothetical protein